MAGDRAFGEDPAVLGGIAGIRWRLGMLFGHRPKLDKIQCEACVRRAAP